MTNEPIAIVGSGCRFAGNSTSPSKLWELLREPRDVRREITRDRFSAKGFYHPNGGYHGHSNVRHAYLLEDDASQFDSEFFGIKPTEAKSMDPQQRLLLETVYEAIEAAGMTVAGLRGSDTSVFAGLMFNDYATMLVRDLAHVPTYHATGVSSAILSNRISYYFDWHGPSMTVDTGCSASLVALHLAVQSLRAGECRMALACGANMILGPEAFIIESKLNMLSPDGRSKMWDQSANGYARGDGIAVVVLKTLSAALADGDHIECVVRETGLNQDGSTPGITMPSASAQEALIRNTYAKAGLDLRARTDRPQYFEAHGTGTPAGDPIEAEAIRNAFFGDSLTLDWGNDLEGERLYVGSIKTVLGHTEGAAGIAAILKASLAIQNLTIPPNLLFDQLSDRIAPFYGHLQIAKSATQWPKLASGQVRRASVNSFGFGGANAHAILESFERPTVDGDPSGDCCFFTPFVFSASSEKALKATLTAYEAHLCKAPTIDMQDLAWTLRQRRSALSYRIAITANSMPDLRSKILAHLQQNETETGIKALPVPEPGRTYRILGVFTGQGAQYARTGAELIEQSPAARAIIEDLELKLAELPSNDRPTWSLQAEIGADATASRVHEAIVSQPLCTAVQILIIELLRLAKVEFAAVVGHSSGEIAAAFAAGYLTAREAIYIAYYRGLHLRSAVSPQGQETRGAMLAVGSSMEEMSKLCRNPEFAGRVTVAASNSSSNVTLSGDEDAIVALQIYFDREKMFNRRLKVDKAYHSAHVAPCSDPYIHSLKACVRERQVQEPGKTCLWFSSVYNTPVDPSLGVSAAYWAENMAKPVLFSQALIKASTEMSLDAVLEIGPHPTLKGPASQTIKDALSSTSRVVPYLGTLSRGVSAIDAFATCLGHLWWHLGPGAVSLDSFERAMSGANRKFSVVKGLPSYPWDHSASYWHEARASRKMKSRKQQVHLLLGDISSDSASHHLRWRNLLRIQEMEWLSGHRIEGQVVFPAAGYICTALEASRMLSGEQDILMIELQEFDVHQAVLLPEDDAGVEVLIELMINPTAQKDCMNARFTYSAALGANVEDLTLAASGNVTVRLGKPSVSLLPRRPTSSSLTHGTKVDTNRFYSALGDIGYTFGGRFCALSELVRKHQRSSSLVKVAHPDAGDESLLIHPADLDAAFQSILLARSYPGDGQLSALHLPTAIRHIRVNPALCRAVDTQGAQIIALDGIVVSGAGDESGIVGDVNLYSSSCPHAMIQLQGANSTPLGGATTKGDDKKLFSTVHWIKQSLDASNFDAVTQYQRDAMKVLEQTSISYLQQFDRQIPSDHSLRSEPPLSFNLGLARRTTSLIQSGEDEPGSKVCTGGTLYHAVGASREFAELPDVRLGKLLGEQLPRLLRGETTMHEQLRQANLLCEYYTNGVVVRASFSWIIGILKQIVDLLPRMNILEIGAGAGEAVTQRIPHAVDNTFLSYTYANISSSIQDDGSAFFSQLNDPKPVQFFDAELDPLSQGYIEGSYDLIIAFWVLHATSSLEQTLHNLRKLLKPGGHLIVSEGSYNDEGVDTRPTITFGTWPWWCTGADHRQTPLPYLSNGQWDELLRRTGFSGIDVASPKESTNVLGATVFVSQAIDEQVAFLRDPVGVPYGRTIIQKLVIVGGLTSRSAHLAEGLQRILSTSVSTTYHFGALEDVDYSIVDQKSTVISLTELDKPVFQDMTPTRFLAFKQMFETGKTLLWITSGRLEDQPYSNLTLGFGRTALVETPNLRLQQLDLAEPQATHALLIAEMILRLASGDSDTVLWPVEPEIVLDIAGNKLVPRLKPIRAFNDRYNSSTRKIETLVNLEETPVTLEMTETSYVAKKSTASHSLSRQSEDLLDLRTVYTTSRAIKTTCGHHYLVLCQDSHTQDNYLVLAPSLMSNYRLPKLHVVPCTADSCDTAFFNLLAARLISTALFDSVYPGQTIVVHNATEPLATAFRAQASMRGFDLFFTADSTNTIAAEANLTFVPYLTKYEISQILPKQISCFVGLSASDAQSCDNEMAIESALPQQCRRERASTIFAGQGLSTAAPSPAVLHSALQSLTEDDLLESQRKSQPRAAVDVRSILEGPFPANELTTIDWTTCTSLPIMIARLDAQQLLANNKTYWIIGLSTALAASLFDWMIERGAKYLVFTSRRPQLDQDWIEFWTRKGVTIETVACDISDETALRSAYKIICARLPPVAGLLNGAAVFRDVSVLEMSFDQLNDVLRPKVLGSLHLARIFADQHLDFFILMSSIVGVLGSAGQANYAAANTFMCGLATQRRKRGFAATAVNLGPIAGLGLLEREDRRVLDSFIQRLSVMPVSEGDFHQIIAEAIEAGRPDSVFCGPELTTALQAAPIDMADAPAFFSNPMFSHFGLAATNEQKVPKTPKVIKSIKELLSKCETETELQSIIRGAFSNEIRKTLQVSTADDDLMAMRSMDLGIDSLVSIDVRTWFSKSLKVNMPVLKVMNSDTLADLVTIACKKVPRELLPNMTSPSTPDTTVAGDGFQGKKLEINWDVETCPPTDLADLGRTSAAVVIGSDSTSVVLTGVSGLLGNHLLMTLLELPSTRKVICIAVRRLEERLRTGELPRDHRVTYYAGELTQPRLGLSKEDAATVFDNVGAVIHAGADTSHLKSYFDLRPINIVPALELVRLCLPRRTPLHFVSSNSVGRYSGKEEVGEVAIDSPGAPKPPTDGSWGYRSTKWAAEGLLERVHDVCKLPIWIHRPSTIIRAGKDAEGLAAELDWMNALILYMDKLSAIPKLNHITGFLDLVNVQTVCTGIIANVLGGVPPGGISGVLYVHHTGDFLLPLDRLEDFRKGSGRKFRKLKREDWFNEAVAAGMHPAVVVLIELLDDPDIKGSPRLVKGPG